MKIFANQRVAIAGMTQCGKTSLVHELIEKYPNRIIYDIKRQYGRFGFVVHNLSGLANALQARCTKIVYQPDDIGIEHFNGVCEYLVRHCRNFTFFVEECHKLAEKHKCPYWFNWLITVCEGDPYNIGIVFIFQRPANVHNDCISQSKVRITFMHELETDAEAITGIPTELIMALNPFEYVGRDANNKSQPLFRGTSKPR